MPPNHNVKAVRMSERKSPDLHNSQLVLFHCVVPGFIGDAIVQNLLDELVITIQYQGLSYSLIYRNGVFMRQTIEKPKQSFVIGYYDAVSIDHDKQALLIERLKAAHELMFTKDGRQDLRNIFVSEREHGLRKFSLLFRELFANPDIKAAFHNGRQLGSGRRGIVRFSTQSPCIKTIPPVCTELMDLMEKLGVEGEQRDWDRTCTLMLAEQVSFSEAELKAWNINVPVYKENMSASPLNTLERSQLETELISTLRREVNSIHRRFYSPDAQEIADWRDLELFMLRRTVCVCKKCKPWSDVADSTWSLIVNFNSRPNIKITDEVLEAEKKVPRLLRGIVHP